MSDFIFPPVPATGVEYRPIPGFPGYIAGTDGSIWSAWMPHKKTRKMAAKWHRKKDWANRGRYRMASLLDEIGKERRLFVHVYILLAFVGPRPKGYDACHTNGDQTDNRPENLRWGSRKENMADCRRHGRLCTGERSHHAKLTNLKVKAARELLARGWSQDDVAAVFGVTQATISKLHTQQQWRDQ